MNETIMICSRHAIESHCASSILPNVDETSYGKVYFVKHSDASMLVLYAICFMLRVLYICAITPGAPEV